MPAKLKIISLFETNIDLSVAELVRLTGYSKQLLHRIVKQLLEDSKLKRLGSAPKTIYRWKTKDDNFDSWILNEPPLEYPVNEFLVITETGELLDGAKAFSYWCHSRNLPVLKTWQEYLLAQNKYEAQKNESGWLNATSKLKNTVGFEAVYLNTLLYLDFYAIERFGKTRLGNLLHYAKQGQSKYLMNMLLEEIKAPISKLIQSGGYDAVAFVPPTLKRQIQIMDFLKVNIPVSLPIVKITKLNGLIPVPQKSLSKIEERIRNANATFTVSSSQLYKHLLLIDDAAGSGATLNQIASKIKAKKIAEEVTGLAIVGSLKGFDVISDI